MVIYSMLRFNDLYLKYILMIHLFCYLKNSSFFFLILMLLIGKINCELTEYHISSILFNAKHMVSLCSPGWDRTCYVYQVILELIKISLPLLLLELKVCATTHGRFYISIYKLQTY